MPERCAVLDASCGWVFHFACQNCSEESFGVFKAFLVIKIFYLNEILKMTLMYLVLSILGKVVISSIVTFSWQLKKSLRCQNLTFLETGLPRNLAYQKPNVSHICLGHACCGKRRGTMTPATARFNSSRPHQQAHSRHPLNIYVPYIPFDP